ncbi:hypothetical protein Aduo_009724 [Ancylostoma duodenale]
MKRAATPLTDAPTYAKRLYIATRQRSYSRSPFQSPTRVANPDELAEQLEHHTRLPQERRRRSSPRSAGTELLRLFVAEGCHVSTEILFDITTAGRISGRL